MCKLCAIKNLFNYSKANLWRGKRIINLPDVPCWLVSHMQGLLKVGFLRTRQVKPRLIRSPRWFIYVTAWWRLIGSFPVARFHPGAFWSKLVTCVILGKGNSKIMNLIKSSFDSPSFLYIPNNEKTSKGHLIWLKPVSAISLREAPCWNMMFT